MSTINCQDNDGRACLAGWNAGHCGEGFAMRCRVRRPADVEQPAVIRIVRGANHSFPDAEQSGEVTICAERVAEEWAGEWLERVRAAITKTTERRVTMPAAFYFEALRHRR